MNNLKTIGALLKDARVSQNLSEEEVSSKTKINLKLLLHLENDRLLKLPNKTYVIGFVKSCARTLGLNEDEAIMSLNYTYEQIIEPSIIKEEACQVPEPSKNELEESAVAVIKSFYNKKIVIGFGVIVSLLLISKAAISFFGNIAKEKVSFEKAEITDLVSKEKITKLDSKIKGPINIKQNEKPKIKENKDINKEKDLDKTSSIKELKTEKKTIEKVVQNNLNGKFPFIKFYPMPEKLFTILDKAEENSNNSILPQRIKNKITKEKQNVYIRAIDGDTWISFKVDDNKIKRYILKQGKGTLLQGDEIQLFMGNINVTKIFLNNKLINAPSKTGVKSLVFPQSLASSLVLPLFPNYKYKSYTSSEYKERMTSETP